MLVMTLHSQTASGGLQDARCRSGSSALARQAHQGGLLCMENLFDISGLEGWWKFRTTVPSSMPCQIHNRLAGLKGIGGVGSWGVCVCV